MRSTLRRAAAPLAIAFTLAACGEAEHRVVLSYPSEEGFQRAALVHLHIGSGLTCPELQRPGSAPDLTFAAQGNAPEVGTIEVGLASFWAEVVDADCQIFLEGCAEVHIAASQDTTVRIYLQTAERPACDPDQGCQGGRCTAADAGVVDAAGLDAGPLDRAPQDGPRVDVPASDAGDAGADSGQHDAAAADQVPFDAGNQARFVAAAQTVTEATASAPSHARRRRIVLDNAAQAEDLIDFPLLVRLEAGVNFDYPGQPGGADLRFTDSASSTLAHEIELWDPTGTSLVWVKVPHIAAGSDSESLFMYYDSPDVDDGQDPAGVWSNGYVGVWHMDQTAGRLRDSSPLRNDLSVVGPVVQGAPGRVGRAASFDYDYVGELILRLDEQETNGLDLPGQLSLEAWVYPTLHEDDLRVVQRAKDIYSSHYGLLVTYGQPQLRIWDNDPNSPDQLTGNTELPLDSWSYLAATYHDGAERARLFVDGRLDRESLSFGSALVPDGLGHLEVGGVQGRQVRTFDGTIDEVRISSVERSPAWIAAQHLSMSGAFATVGPEELLPRPPPVQVQATVQLEAPADTDVVVPFTVGGTAGAADHDLVAGSVTIPRGEQEAALGFSILDDRLYEGDEQLVITLGAPSGAALGSPAAHAVTIQDDEPLPALRVAGAATTEGSPLALAVEIDQRAERDVTFTWSTIGESAAAGQDFTAVDGAVGVIAAGALGTTLEVDTLSDGLDEDGEELLQIVLSAPTHASIDVASAYGGIRDADGGGQPSLDLHLDDCSALPAQLSFARASTATYVDATGVLRQAAADEPRCDHDLASRAPLGLLVEGPATNLWRNSRAQSGTKAAYTRIGTEDASFSVTAGGLWGNGDYKISIRRTNPTGWEGFGQTVDGLVLGERYTLSFVAQQAAGDVPLYVYDNEGVLSVGPTAFELGAEPQRYHFTFVATASSGLLRFAIRSNGDPGEGWDVSHIQLELGATPSSIIVNDLTDGPAARAADLASVAGLGYAPAASSLAAAVQLPFAPARAGQVATVAAADGGAAQGRWELLVLNADGGPHGAAQRLLSPADYPEVLIDAGARWPHGGSAVLLARYSRALPQPTLFVDGERHAAPYPLPGDLPAGLTRLLLGRREAGGQPADFLDGPLLWLRLWARSVEPGEL